MGEKEQPKWQAAARITILGEKHELESLPGYWFTPRKYSTIGSVKINGGAMKLRTNLPKGILKKLAKGMGDKEKDAQFTGKEAMKLLTEDEISQVMDAQKGDEGAVSFQKDILIYGIGEHGFDGDYNIESLAEELLEYPDVAAEMIEIIKEWNSPLAQTTSETSGTS